MEQEASSSGTKEADAIPVPKGLLFQRVPGSGPGVAMAWSLPHKYTLALSLHICNSEFLSRGVGPHVYSNIYGKSALSTSRLSAGSTLFFSVVGSLHI